VNIHIESANFGTFEQFSKTSIFSRLKVCFFPLNYILPGDNNHHDHDVADQTHDEDAEVGDEQHQDHTRGHDQRLLNVITANQN
jgi:hypothetical protein